MTIVFFSNVLNHHQVALCDELHRQNNGDFYFVETGSLNSARKAMGFSQFERGYIVRAKQNPDEALRLAMCADIAIMGAESHAYLKSRLNCSDKISFSYSERWFKQGFKNILSPALLKQAGLYFRGGNRRRWYVLAAGAYLANDFAKLGIFKNKVYKWGYFPLYKNKEKQTGEEGTAPVKILWVGRMIDWKRPELMIDLAERLLADGSDFKMTLIGDGVMSGHIKALVSDKPELGSRITLKGNLTNDKVLAEMSASDIFCFTSTRREGWGAVLGEAMACGCCPVASADAGATPYLVKHKANGLVFHTGSCKDLHSKVKYLIDNRKAMALMGDAAKKTMLEEWDAASAAREFIKLARIKLEDSDATTEYSSLPASPARPTKQ